MEDRRDRECAREGCSESLEGRRRHAKYCSGECCRKDPKNAEKAKKRAEKWRADNPDKMEAQRENRKRKRAAGEKPKENTGTCAADDCNNSLKGKRAHAKYCSRECKDRARSKRRLADPKERQKNIDRARKWVEDNYEEARRQNSERYWNDPEKRRKSSREYAKTPRGRDVARASHAKRRAAGPVRAADIDALWLGKKSMACPCGCGKRMRRNSRGTWHVDHIIPVNGKEAKGDSRPANLRLMRPECNGKKSNQLQGW